MSKCLKMTLKGLLQSYGTEASGWIEHRGTSPVPTASAMTGLIGCALGIPKQDPALIDLSNSITLYCEKTFETEFDPDSNKKCTKSGPSILYDFQIISPRRIPGIGKPVTPDLFVCADVNKDGSGGKSQIVSGKDYIVNQKFTVYVEAEQTLLEKIHDALLNPKWPIYFGRACCMPAQPLVEQELELTDADTIKEKCICLSR